MLRLKINQVGQVAWAYLWVFIFFDLAIANAKPFHLPTDHHGQLLIHVPLQLSWQLSELKYFFLLAFNGNEMTMEKGKEVVLLRPGLHAEICILSCV